MQLVKLTTTGVSGLRTCALAIALLVASFAAPTVADAQHAFTRGDINQDSSVSIVDAISLLSYLFAGLPGQVPACNDAADVNDDGHISLSDPIVLLTNLFGGGGPLPAPTNGECGADPTADALGCDNFAGCTSLTGKWQLSYTEVGNDCGKPLESGTTEVMIRQNGDVIDLEIGDQGGVSRYVGFQNGTTIELFGAQVASNYSSSMNFLLTVSAAGNSIVGSAFQLQEEPIGICNHEYTLNANRIGDLDPPAPPTHDFTALMDVSANPLISYCGGGASGGTVTIDFAQSGNNVAIEIPGLVDVIAFGTVSGDTLRIHVETEEAGGREIRIGTLTATPNGFLTGEVSTLVDAATGLCGGIEEWIAVPPTTGPPTVNEVATLGTTFGSVAGATDNFTGSCWVDTLPDRAYQFTAPGAGLYQIDTYGSVTDDTVLFVLDAAGNEIACNDQAGGTGHSELVLDLAAGDMIVIVIDVYTSWQSEEFQLNINHALSPLADEFAALGSMTGSVAGEDDDYSGSCWADTLPDRACQFSAPESNTYRIDTFGSQTLDTVLFVLDSAGNEIACNDQAGGTGHSELFLNLAAGEMVIIVIDVYTPWQSEEFQLNISTN